MVIIITCILLSSSVYADLIKPANGQELRYIHILFEWEQEPDAIAYNLQASIDLSFNNNILDIEQQKTSYIDIENFTWDSDYYWRVKSIYSDGSSSGWIATASFSTKDTTLPNLDVNTYDDNFFQSGIMVYSQFSPYFAVGAIDALGNEVWNTVTAYMNYISPYGEIYGVRDPGTGVTGGVKFNFNHEVLWETPEDISIDSHEVKQIPSGNFMAFSPTFQIGPIPIGPWTDLAQNFGYAADGTTYEFPWMGLRIVEFDKETSEEVWSWDPFEYFSMNDYDQYEGYWWQAIFDGVFDWMHTNAFHFDEEESVIYVSHRHLSRISKISYPSGEVIWNMGLPEEYGTGADNICTDLGFSFQHHIQLMDDGTLLFFDNGNISDVVAGDETPITRLRRIRVIDNSYCETVWQYDLPADLHGVGMGSVQLLDNDNYFVYSYGDGLDNPDCGIFEVNNNGEILWQATSQNPNSAWYRSYKIPSIHPSAFSVIADGYTINDNDNVIQMWGDSLNFKIYNTSGYTQPYLYQFHDLTDSDNHMFDYFEGEFELAPDEDFNLSIPQLNTNVESANISLYVWPRHHSYDIKELFFSVISNIDLGDINGDNNINVLDVVLLVNSILNSDSFTPNSDLNGDNIINILDVVLLVNTILGSN